MVCASGRLTLLAKVKSGAQFAQTQFCMDAAIVRRYVGALAEAGITRQLAILIGVNPLRSAKSARWMRSHLYGTIIPDAFIERMEKEGIVGPANHAGKREILVEGATEPY